MASDNLKKLHNDPEFKEKIRKASIQNWKNYNKSDKAKIEAKKAGERGSKFFKEKNSDPNMINLQKLSRIKKIVLKSYEIYGYIDENTYEKIRKNFYNYPKYEKALFTLKECNIDKLEDLLEENIIKQKLNHKIKSIEIIESPNTKVYCLTVFEYENFSLASGVFVHNCGMSVWKFKKLPSIKSELQKLDKTIIEKIPSGHDIREQEHSNASKIDLGKLKCTRMINLEKVYNSIGTLGGGNHFIELNEDNEGYYYLVVHSGSRYLGVKVATYYQKLAFQKLSFNKELAQKETKEMAEKMKKEGKQRDIPNLIKEINNKHTNKNVIYELAYVEGQDLEDYLYDIDIAQKYASLNRKTIGEIIIKEMKWKKYLVEEFETIHNYIDLKNMILRKGSISAQLGEKVIIPMNMRDGSLIAIGKGNEDWNYSAPHGAGRLMSRSEASERITLNEFKKSMKGIYSSSVVESTIDESPMAYKSMTEIIENTKDTVDVINIIKPIYNYKAH